MRGNIGSFGVRKLVLAACALGAAIGALPLEASATTVATFEWIESFSSTAQNPPTVPTGSLTLSLPDSVTTQTFTTPNYPSSALALAAITGFSYNFSDGASVTLGDLSFANSEISVSPNAWMTSQQVAPPRFIGPGVSGFYLITGFNLRGSRVFPGNTQATTFLISNAAGSPTNVTQASNQVTPFFPPFSGSNDSGYWRLTSLALNPVPLPAALPLLLSGLAGFGGVAARRRRAA